MIKFAIDRRSLFKATGALVVSVGIPGGAGYCEAVEVRFAADSPVEGGVSCELVSENAKFPASRENTGNFIDSGLGGASEAAKRA